ncbi:hypothetical protein EF913_34200 [Streptomyces sp. WAC04189]|nr:hypothetical protein EF913_34200 [Streptomyces sp. WAC04189]
MLVPVGAAGQHRNGASCDDTELLALVRRYVTPKRRYPERGGSLLRMRSPECDRWGRRLSGSRCVSSPWCSGSICESAPCGRGQRSGCSDGTGRRPVRKPAGSTPGQGDGYR